jgi:hypothetical protein
MSARRYIAWMLGTVLALAMLAIALTVFADPYYFFGTPRIAGINALKPRVYQQASLAKTTQLERMRPRTLLVGNSRIEIGFDPDSSAWPTSAQPVFNAAEAATSPLTAARRLEDADATVPPKLVIAGVDFPDFFQPPSDPSFILPLLPAEQRLRVDRDGRPNADRWLQTWHDRFAATLTVDALFDSVSTLLDQDPRDGTTMTPHGFNPLREYQVAAQRVGYYGLFEQKNTAFAAQYSHAPKLDFSDTTRIESFRYLDRLITAARAHDQRLILVINPYHAQYLDLLKKLGLWPAFEEWKAALVRTVAASRMPAGAIKLYDFSGYNAISEEPVPPEGDLHSAMHWYWEAGHYKSPLGDKIIARIFGRDTSFGIDLTPPPLGTVVANRSDAAR